MEAIDKIDYITSAGDYLDDISPSWQRLRHLYKTRLVMVEM
jgi:hypothetical protein